MRRYLVLMMVLLSLLDHANSAQSQGKQAAAGSTTDGSRYHSDYFDFTYSLPDGFVEGTEQYRSLIRALPGAHPDPDTFVLLSAGKRSNEGADPVDAITVTVDALSRYPKGITEKDYIHRTTKSMAFKGDALLQEGEQADVSGWSFFRADYKMNGHPNSGYLTVMLTFRKDFALSWQFFALSKEEVDSIAGSMQRMLITK